MGTVQPQQLRLGTVVAALHTDCLQKLPGACSLVQNPNNQVLVIGSKQTSPLAFALLTGAVNSFKYLVEACHGSLAPLCEELLTVHKTSLFSVLLERNSSELLLICLPYDLQHPMK